MVRSLVSPRSLGLKPLPLASLNRHRKSLISDKFSLQTEKNSLLRFVGNFPVSLWNCDVIEDRFSPVVSTSGEIPCYFPVNQGIQPETGSLQTGCTTNKIKYLG